MRSRLERLFARPLQARLLGKAHERQHEGHEHGADEHAHGAKGAQPLNRPMNTGSVEIFARDETKSGRMKLSAEDTTPTDQTTVKTA